MGDSKTASGEWQPLLMASLRAETGLYQNESFTIRATSGSSVANYAALINTYLSDVPQEARYVLINLGVNELPALPSSATWQSNYLTILDAVNARYPNAQILVAKPWRAGFDAAADTVAGWIDSVVAARSSFTALGHDERGWLKGADNGATMTTDGVHYSSAGNTEAAEQWLTAIMVFE